MNSSKPQETVQRGRSGAAFACPVRQRGRTRLPCGRSRLALYEVTAMLPAWLRRLGRFARVSGPGKPPSKPRRRSRLLLEQLEDRVTPTGNIVLTNAFLVDVHDHP